MYIILLLKISILEFAQMHCTVAKQKKTKKNNSLCTKCMKVDKPRLKNTINLLDFYKVQKGCIQEQWTQFQRDLGIKFPVLWLSFVSELHLAWDLGSRSYITLHFGAKAVEENREHWMTTSEFSPFIDVTSRAYHFLFIPRLLNIQ